VCSIDITKNGTDLFYEVSLKFHQKLDKIYIFIALGTILLSQAEIVGDMHNQGWN
jgi:hypothetical protein